jgi:ubiquinone/menaquinone biosynthesis C-methylase UbiE
MFGSFVGVYDFAQNHLVRPRIHKADPKRHQAILRNLISSAKNSRVLDIACGTGGAIVHLDNSNEYTGLDLSYAMLKHAVKKARKKCFRESRFIQGNAEDLLFETECFDFVLMDTALHLIPDYQMAIAEAARVLSESGVFICSTPVVGISEEFDKTWKKISQKRGVHSFTEDDIMDICSRNGLDFTRIDTNGGVIYFRARK